MANCKDDFLEEIEGHKVLCAIIKHGDDSWQNDIEVAELKVGYSPSVFQKFLDKINYEYDSGFGGQEVFGNIWYTDGTWSERGEYDGSEWWEYKSCPPIPNELKC